MTVVDRPPYVQACLMIECHADYNYAIKLARENIKLYSDTHKKWNPVHSEWWREVMHELIKMRRNHHLTDHEYYQEITGELDD